MGVSGYDDLRNHIGHNVVVVCYGKKGKAPDNVAVECEDCNEVLFDFDKPTKSQEAGKCPKCGEALHYGMMEPDDDGIFYEVDCPKCKYSGHEFYNTVFDGFDGCDEV